MNFRRSIFCLAGMLCLASVRGAEVRPNLVLNPKLLVPPISLMRADTYLDWDGRVSGILQDSEGRSFQFAVVRNELTVRFAPDRRYPAYAAAKFDGWELSDFATLLEATIQRQFTWDAKAQRLRTKNPEEHEARSARFTETGAKRLLRWAEYQLKRKPSFMTEANP
jgi:hypothetical protein